MMLKASVKHVSHLTSLTMEDEAMLFKSRIWICPECSKLYLTLFPRRRAGAVCTCGHCFDLQDAIAS